MGEVVNNFCTEKNRYPTFWLDVVCVDQGDIKHGLKVLPINVMACSKMLVLWGETYPKRLWCVWELCTLFSMMPEAQARERLMVVAIGDADEMLEKARAFDFREAQCYDPNVENRLTTVIAAVGEERFNDCIRQFGR